MEELRKNIRAMIDQELDKDCEYYVEPEEFDRIELKSIKNGYKIRDGIPLTDMIRNLNLVKNMELRDDDVFSIGYPKSGSKFFKYLEDTLFCIFEILKHL